MTTVYVVFTWRDYRKENDADILGVYLDYSTATQKLKEFAEEFANENGGNIEERLNCYTVINGNDYQVFQTKMMPII